MKVFKRSLALIAVIVIALSVTASASSPYNSFVYDNNGIWYSAPDAFEYDYSIDFSDITDDKGKKLGALLEPSDVYKSDDGLIYISDTGNGRVIVLNDDYSCNRVIKKFKNTIESEGGGKTVVNDKLYAPKCVFVHNEYVEKYDKNVDVMYVCDQTGAKPGNTDYDIVSYKTDEANKKYSPIDEEVSGRILKLNAETGEWIDTIVGINSSVLPEDFIFQPTDVVVDAAGRIFALSKSFNMGIMELNARGEFVQCLGAPSVTYNVIELIWRYFSTEQQLDRMESFVPTEYSGIDIDDDGFIYVTNSTFTKENASSVEGLNKLNAKGKNVLRTGEFIKPYGDTNASWMGTFKGPSRLTDVMTLDYGMYAVLDKLRGRVFFYNNDGMNLFNFGTTVDTPDKDHKYYVKGTFVEPVALEWNNGSCIVLDSTLQTLSIFNQTEYAKKIIYASKLHFNDQYDEEVHVWKKILAMNNNSAAAKRSIGMVYYRNGEWKTAMDYFKLIFDQENYSKAFKYQRQDYIERYFTAAVIVLVLLCIAIAIGKKLYRKYVPKVKEKSYIGQLKFSGTVIFRPLYSGWILTRENCGTVLSATTILISASLMSLLQARYTGFIFDANAQYVNIFLEFAKIIAPLMLFCVCNWCVTSLLNGEGNFRSIYIASAYSLTPIIILYPFAILLSNIMVAEEGDFYTVFVSLALVWVLLLIFTTNMRIHDFNLGMTIMEIVITLVVMLLVIFLAILFFALCQQMYDFIVSIVEEIANRS